MNCPQCGLEILEGHVHVCLESLKAEVARLHTVIGNQRENHGKTTQRWAETADMEREAKEAALLRIEALKKALIAECKGEACNPEDCHGGYRKCTGCETRAKKALGDLFDGKLPAGVVITIGEIQTLVKQALASNDKEYQLIEVVRTTVEYERAGCAKVCDELGNSAGGARLAAKRIRERIS